LSERECRHLSFFYHQKLFSGVGLAGEWDGIFHSVVGLTFTHHIFVWSVV
jgi:hypothetical protein